MNALPPARLRNMDARRQRILDEAGRMLGEGGTEALTLRGLALAAGVTVPTIYNLIGGKDQIINALIESCLDQLDTAMHSGPGGRGLARATAAVQASVALFIDQPGRYGAVFRALQDVQKQPGEVALGALFRRAGEVYCQAVAEAQADGDLHGRLLALPLGHHILHAQIENFRVWGIGALPPPAAHARAFYALYVGCMADATKQGRKYLLEQLRVHEAALNY